MGDTPPSPAWNEARSVHVGLDRVDDAVYEGWLEALSGAEADARAMRGLADAMGFSSRVLLSQDATRRNVADCLASTIERLVEGDVLVVTYAGHMTTLAGVGDDRDGWDEAWCLHDGILLDDEFHDLLSDVPAGVDVLVVTDSCFAGGLADGAAAPSAVRPALVGSAPARWAPARSAPARWAPARWAPARRVPASGPATDARTDPPGVPPDARIDPGVSLRAVADEIVPRAPAARLGDLQIARLVRQGAIPYGRARPSPLRRGISANVVALSAAAEGSLAFEGKGHGLFTAAILETVERRAGERLSYGELLASVAAMLPFQRPSIGVLGGADATAAAAPAFAASRSVPSPRSDAPLAFLTTTRDPPARP